MSDASAQPGSVQLTDSQPHQQRQGDQQSSAGEQVMKKTARQLWEEDEARRKLEPHVTLEMGARRMCEVGGCGYFSDEDK
jgi:hypothetical protein